MSNAANVPAQSPPAESAFGLTAVKRMTLVVVGFATHVIVGTVLFGLIAGAAILLEHAIGALNPRDEFVHGGLRFASHLIFGLDLFAFVVFLTRSTYRFCRELWGAI